MVNEMLEELDFTRKMKTMKDRDLLEFMAGQVYEICQVCPKHTISIEKHEGRLTVLEERDRKTFGAAGAVGGGAVAILGGVIIFVLKHFGITV